MNDRDHFRYIRAAQLNSQCERAFLARARSSWWSWWPFAARIDARVGRRYSRTRAIMTALAKKSLAEFHARAARTRAGEP